MDHNRFDALARSIAAPTSRRRLSQVLTGGLAMIAAASFGDFSAEARKKRRKKKKPHPQPAPECTPNCTDRTCGSDGCGGSCGDCTAGQTCQGGTCCTPESRIAACGGRCGTRSNNCGQPVTCPCPAGKTCLGNGTCARTCDAMAQNCPETCVCTTRPTAEGEFVCRPAAIIPCEQATQVCTSSAECPQGTACQAAGYSCTSDGAFRCIPLCQE